MESCVYFIASGRLQVYHLAGDQSKSQVPPSTHTDTHPTYIYTCTAQPATFEGEIFSSIAASAKTVFRVVGPSPHSRLAVCKGFSAKCYIFTNSQNISRTKVTGYTVHVHCILYMYTCMYAYTHLHPQTHIHIHTHAHPLTHTCTCIYIIIYTHSHTMHAHTQDLLYVATPGEFCGVISALTGEPSFITVMAPVHSYLIAITKSNLYQ